MAKSELTFEGKVTQALSRGNFEVELDIGNKVICTLSGRMRQNFIKVISGDRVLVEMSPYDVTKGRIARRFGGSQNPGFTPKRRKK